MSVICGDCGHHKRLRDDEGRCRASRCSCALFTAAVDAERADAATEAARARLSTEQRLLSTARRALAMKHYDEALGACLALLNETKETR